MPWSADSYPNSFKSLTVKQRNKAISIANNILKSCIAKGGKSESECAGIAIATALSKVKESSMAEENKGSNTLLAEVTRLSEIVKNFNDGVRGVKVAIDIAHEPDRGAVAWIEGLELGPSSTQPGKQALWAMVKWNKTGINLIANEVYKYISSEFGDDVNGENGKVTKNVLIAATLTNRPFVKGMTAVELDEDGNPPSRIEILREGDYFHPSYGKMVIKAEETQSLVHKIVSAVLNAMGKETLGAETVSAMETDEGNEANKLSEVEEMDQIRELLVELGVKLEEDTDVMEALKAHIATLSTAAEESEKKLEEAGEEDSKVLEEKLATAKKLEEEQAKAKKLEEEKKALEDEKETLADRVVKLEEVNRLAERDRFLSQMIRDGKLRPADKTKFEDLYDKAPDEVKNLLSEGEVVVDLGNEIGSDSDNSADDEDDADLKAAKTLAAKDGIGLAEAYTKVIALGKGE